MAPEDNPFDDELYEFERDEGDPCPCESCPGVMGYEPVRDCSCHISPPCSRCHDKPLICLECGWGDGDEIEQGVVVIKS